MNPNKKILIVKAGDTRTLVASINYQKLQSQDMITWKKNPSRLLFAIEDNGDIHSSGKEFSTNYKFTKQDVGKYIKFYSYCNEFNALAQAIVFYVEGEHDTDVDIIGVERVDSDSEELYTGDRLELKATFSMAENRVSPKTDENVKWMVKVNGEEERLILDGLVMTGSEIEFVIPEDWVNEEVVLMPYLHEHSEEVSYRGKVVEGKKILEFYWTNDKKERIDTLHSAGETAYLYVKTKGYATGDLLSIELEDDRGDELHLEQSKATLDGEVDDSGEVWLKAYNV